MTRITAIILLLITAIGAIFGGGALLIDPLGEKLGLPIETLKYSPFENFLIPGLILFIILGLGSLITSIIVIKRVSGYPFLTIFMGFAISIFISVEILMLKDVKFLQIIFAIIGISLVILGIILRKKEYGLKL